MKNFTSICLNPLCWLAFLSCFVYANHIQAQTDNVIFEDNFERNTFGADWEVGTAWSIVNGKAYNNYDGTGSSLTTAQAFSQTSYIIETQAKPFFNGYFRQYQLTFGQQGDTQRYSVSYDPYAGGILFLGRVDDNIIYPSKLDETVIKLDTAKWYKFRVEKYDNGLIQVYLNDGSGFGETPILEAIDTTYKDLGKFGWFISTETIGEDFFVEYITASVPQQQKTKPEKPAVDELIKKLTVANGKTYEVDKLNVGVVQYTDRPYVITSLPSYLEGASFVRTANSDKTVTSATFLDAYIKGPVVAYIAYDPRATALPAWLKDWIKTGDIIGTNDPGSSYFEVYTRILGYYDTYPRPLKLGGNLASPAVGSNMNYLLIATPQVPGRQYEAEDASLSGPVVASNNPGYSGSGFADYINNSRDYVEWTIDIAYPGAYRLLFEYANGGTYARPLSITIDSKLSFTKDFQPTFGWSDWVITSLNETIYLSAGTHKIRTTAINKSGPNIDYMFVSPSYDTPVNAIGNELLAARTDNHEVSLSNHLTHGSFPNTFAEETTLFYELDVASTVNLSVYDIQGKLIRKLVTDEQQAEGHHEVLFQAKGLQDGLYMYQLQTSGSIVSGRLLLKR